MEYLLIVHHESGDEIHFTVIDYSFYSQLTPILGSTRSEEVGKLLDIIYNNKVESLMCQTYVLEDYSKIAKYNIVKTIYIPELGE